eukprot:CAMPEP_0198729944 /NCGR_PEP_ID=MMETSP1475-20131203/21918_1 /TAXON_ID= ORGANISM="Unidentified sp., Strain CCMP1999" /NCGR_SAMPLE_ID=MMETSP1475 /ASSEMBLY_ACC=CAM_ASM_001111 /LENGTH=402 /DNA_ID=CAMNT_0044492675 /DNA_START=55 /DNA_END=1266 /DNA_ORIENTATION=+
METINAALRSNARTVQRMVTTQRMLPAKLAEGGRAAYALVVIASMAFLVTLSMLQDERMSHVRAMKSVERVDVENAALQRSILAFRRDYSKLEKELEKSVRQDKSQSRSREYMEAMAPDMGVGKKAESEDERPVRQQKPISHNGMTYNSIFSKILVMNQDNCVKRWNSVQQWAKVMQLDVTRFSAVHNAEIDIFAPPSDISIELDFPYITPEQVGRYYSHFRIWKLIVERGYSRVLVLEDHIRLHGDVLQKMPQLFEKVDQAAEEKGKPWHYMFFGRYALKGDNEEKWCDGPSGTPVTIASPSWGHAAYAITNEGARFLLEKISVYRKPLDVQISELQDGKTFIALSACNNDEVAKLCPENVYKVDSRDNYDCDGHGSQIGSRWTQESYHKKLAAVRNKMGA